MGRGFTVTEKNKIVKIRSLAKERYTEFRSHFWGAAKLRMCLSVCTVLAQGLEVRRQLSRVASYPLWVQGIKLESFGPGCLPHG